MKNFKLGEISNITMGQSPQSKYYNSKKNGLPFLQGRTTFGRMFPYYGTWTSQYNKVAEKDDILMSVRAPVGDLNICQTKTAIGRGIASLKGVNILTKYLYYLLLANKEHICTRSTGSVYDSISKPDLENLFFDIHNPQEQQHIVNILGSFDEKIENNEKIVEKLDSLLINNYKKFSENDNYKIVRMDEVFDITIGRTPPRKEQKWFTANNNGIKWISIADMGNCNQYIFNTSEELTREAIKQFNVQIVQSNTLLLSFKLTVGRIAITTEKMATNEAIAHFNTNNKFILPYLYCYMKNYNFQTLGNTSSIANATNSKTVKAMKFLLPSDSNLQSFYNQNNLILNKIFECELINKKLNELKQLYLKKFFG